MYKMLLDLAKVYLDSNVILEDIHKRKKKINC